MKYRGLTYNKEKESYEWVYGLPSYGYATDEVAEIGTVYGDFKEIFPDTLGEQTPYRDKNGKRMYTGDIAALEVDGQVREFVVDKATVDREYNTLQGFTGKDGSNTVKVRLADVVIFRWIDPEGVIHQLLPCVNEAGVSDTASMEIIGTIAERGVQESESKGKKQQYTVSNMDRGKIHNRTTNKTE